MHILRRLVNGSNCASLGLANPESSLPSVSDRSPFLNRTHVRLDLVALQSRDYRASCPDGQKITPVLTLYVCTHGVQFGTVRYVHVIGSPISDDFSGSSAFVNVDDEEHARLEQCKQRHGP